MPITEKQDLVESIGNELRSRFTAEQLEDIKRAAAQVLNDFQVMRETHDNMTAGDRDIYQAFIQSKSLEGRTDKTVKRYSYEIERMLRSLNCPLGKVTVYDLRGYLSKLKQGGASDRTLEGVRYIMSSFFTWCHKEGLTEKNPCANLGTIKYAKVQREGFSAADMERLREACTCLRDRAIISFLYCTGCRINEAVALDVSDVDLMRKEVRVFGKGRKERMVYLDDVTVMIISRYIASRTDGSRALFSGRGSERLSANGVRCMLKKLQAVSGVDNVHPHRFRRTLATNLINHGMPLQEVSNILGHENVDTTMTYVYVDQARVKNNYMRIAQ